jgi:formylglycine-generating enzyme required for sulfatase activity
MKHRTLLAILAILALVTLSCGVIDDLIGGEVPEVTQPPATPGIEQPTSPPTLPPEAPALPEQAAPITRPADGMVMIHIPAGEFTMGDDRSAFAPEKPQHLIYLDDYWMDRTEVTNAQYRLCMEAEVCTEPKIWWNPDLNGDDQPALVPWEAAQAYCEWVGGRLPTEAEWEKAARGIDGRLWPWGNEFEPNRANLSGDEDGYGPTAPVGSFPGDASPYGLLDIAGNAAEWVADWYDAEYYAHSPARNPTGPASGDQKIHRGTIANAGGGPEKCRCVARYPADPNWEYGFRCAATTPPGGKAAPPSSGQDAPPSSAEAVPTSPPEHPPSQEGPLPADLAWEEIPVYPGASEIVKEVTASFPPGSTDYELVGSRSYETDDEVEKVADFYLAEMPKKGWEKIVHIPMGESYTSVWQKGDGKFGVTIGIGEQEGKTYIAIIVGREK